MKIISYFFIFHSPYSQAIPIAQGGAVATPCAFGGGGETRSYTITGQKIIAGPVQQLPFSCKGEGGARKLFCYDWDPFLFSNHANVSIVTVACTLGRAQTFSVAVTVTVGANLGLEFEKIGSVGLETSVSYTTETGSADTAEVECQGPWTCGLLMTPDVLEVSGEQTTTSGGCVTTSHKDPYTVQFPVKVGETAKAGFSACACPNKLDWATAGAPPRCPNDCWGNSHIRQLWAFFFFLFVPFFPLFDLTRRTDLYAERQ